MKPDPRRLNPSTYPYTVDIQTRYADLDPQAHINNVRIMEMYQEARVALHHSLGESGRLGGEDPRVLVVKQSVDYLSEVRWPGAVSITVGIAHIGNSSYSLAMAMFQNSGCVGLSDTVLVHATAAGPTSIPDPLRAAFATKMLR